MKVFIHSIILLFLIVKEVISGEISDDICEFDKYYPDFGTYQVICYYSHQSSSDTHIFAHTVLDDKFSAMDLYKNIHISYETDNRGTYTTLAQDKLSDYSNISEFMLNQILCVLRGSSMKKDAPIVPSTVYLNTQMKYKFFPSIKGYHPKGGSSVFTHIKTLKFDGNFFMNYNVIGWNIFKAEYNNYFRDSESTYANEVASSKAAMSLWGPYYRYSPIPEYRLNSTHPYYTYPRVKLGNKLVNLDAVIGDKYLFTGTIGSNATTTQNLNNFFSATDGDIEYFDCEYNDSKYYVLKGNSNCTYTSDIIECGVELSNIPITRNPSELIFEGFCRDKIDGSKWVYLIEGRGRRPELAFPGFSDLPDL